MSDDLSNETNVPVGAASQHHGWQLLKRWVAWAMDHIILWILLMMSLGAWFVYMGFDQAGSSMFYYMLREVGKALFVAAFVSGAAKLYMTRQLLDVEERREELSRAELRNALNGLDEKVIAQTERMTASTLSLTALQKVGAVRFYQNRTEAAGDIKKALVDDNTTVIKIVGISLNDFARDEVEALHEAWQTIQKYVTGQQPRSTSLAVQVLVIDPTCNGAILRAHAEQKQDNPARLASDVEASIANFLLLKETMSLDGNVTFDARVYRIAPILYLAWTPSVSFVQQYYFRPRHVTDVNIPVVQYHQHQCVGVGQHSMHDELRFHFDWIWDHASIPLEKYKGQFCRGVDEATRSAHIENIYYDPALARKRILYLIENTRQLLWIKGVSLHSFFQYGDLFNAIGRTARHRDVDSRVLLLDPDCEQALIRSFREFLLSHPSETREHFTDETRRSQRLYRDTTDSIENIRLFVEGCEREGQKLSRFQARKFTSAPEAFVLITDDAAMVEQYHYGKIRGKSGTEEAASWILSGDMPIIEYRRVEECDDRLKDPYRILKDHFQYAFDNSAKPLFPPRQ